MTMALKESYGTFAELQFGRPYELPEEGIIAEPCPLPNVAIGNAAVEASKLGPEATKHFGLVMENFGFAVDTAFSEIDAAPYRLYEASHKRWNDPTVQGVLANFKRIAGAARTDSCLRDDVVATGEASGTRVYVGRYLNARLHPNYLLVESEGWTGVGRNTRRYLDLVPMPLGEKHAAERAETILRVTNAFSFEETDAVKHILMDNSASPGEIAEFLATHDRRTVQSVMDVEMELALQRARAEEAPAAPKPGMVRRIAMALGAIGAGTERGTGAVL